MAKKELRILVASDGSLSATAALTTLTHWPWPAGTTAEGIVAQQLAPDGRADARAELEREARDVRDAAERILQRRWPDAPVRQYAGDPAAMIIRQAQRARADLIVVGWRGHGVMRRLLVGSVSRGVVREASCSVLVVRRASRQLRRIVIGHDGSANADRAVRFVARLAPRDARISLVMSAAMMQAPRRSMVSDAAIGTLNAEVERVNKRRTTEARGMLDQAAKPLRDASLKVEYIVSGAAPLVALLETVDATKADLLVVGATGATALRGLLLGSVAQGALDRSRVPVLVVR